MLAGGKVIVEAAGGRGGKSADDQYFAGGSGGAGGGVDFPTAGNAYGGGTGGAIGYPGGDGQVEINYITGVSPNVLFTLDGSASSDPKGGQMSSSWANPSHSAP